MFASWILPGALALLAWKSKLSFFSGLFSAVCVREVCHREAGKSHEQAWRA